ncbi:uncharacterized protein LOC118559875 [Fundulus heteroclitus]|uniref:uncharacterized protein LOC118559875 n=1 Tax=Fundulus heteroclitus TaxID=8078 RepID=UPI00165BA5AD|nr:uncharacterized protein LOC118559875 [Fundulus heteroclitus]
MKQRGTMEESRWRKMFVFFLLLLQIPGAESRDLSLYFTIRAGDDVTLPCENVPHGYSDCSSTSWLHSKSGQAAVELVELGQVKDGRSDRLSVSADCSLVLKKVTAEDVGLYSCRQFISGTQSGPDAEVHLSLVNLREDQNQNMVTLTCSVSTYGQCKNRVRWLYNNKNVDKDNRDVTESSSSCSAAVSFQTSHYIYPSRFNLFSCEVKTEDDKLLTFTFGSRPSVTTTPVTPKLGETPDDRKTGPPWLYIILPLVLVALIITVVVFVLLRRTKGNNTEHKSGEGDTHRPLGTQSACENQQHEADAENGVSYASISYTKKPNSRSQVKSDGDNDTVTYSTVKASSADTNCLYASINKPNNPV